MLSYLQGIFSQLRDLDNLIYSVFFAQSALVLVSLFDDTVGRFDKNPGRVESPGVTHPAILLMQTLATHHPAYIVTPRHSPAYPRSVCQHLSGNALSAGEIKTCLFIMKWILD